MPVSDFECQIARGQIGRYLDGGALSAGAMTGLEEHLAECPDCKSLVERRRAALLGALGGELPTRAVVSMPVENPLVAALRAKAAEEERNETAPEKKPETAKAAPRYAKDVSKRNALGKPLALAALLAVVLLAMSRVTRSMTRPTARAASSFAAETVPIEAPKPRAPAPKPVAEAKPAPPAERPIPKPLVPKPVAPKPRAVVPPSAPKRRIVRPKRAATPRAKRPARKRPAPRKPRTTVRVYGLDGRPLAP